jgi:catechol 2,3-dioxygenase-like lactoylglutathione lyase family enzyme
MDEVMAFDHIHLTSRDPKAAADWYREMFGGEVTALQENLRGAPQIDVRVGGMTIVVRGQRPGEHAAETKPTHHFDGYSSHDELGIDHFAFTYRGDLRGFCAELRRRGARMAVEPWEFKPGVVLCYVAAPDGVSIELIQVGSWGEDGT